MRIADGHPGLRATIVIPSRVAWNKRRHDITREGRRGPAPPGVRVAAGRSCRAAEAARRLEGWWGDLPPEEAQPLREIAETMPQAGAILAGIAEASPYLFDLLRADAGRALRLLRCDPDERLAALLAQAETDVAAASSEAEVMAALRRMKSEAALLIALCDIGGVWPVMRVTQALTDIAGMAAQCASASSCAGGRRGPAAAQRGAAGEGSGIVVMARACKGAGECTTPANRPDRVYDLEAPTLAEGIEPPSFFVRSRRAVAAPAAAHRRRLRLPRRPAAGRSASTPVAVSTQDALNY